MNIGIYLENINSKEFEFSEKILSYGLSNKLINDGCVFYDNIGQLNKNTIFGLFNSTDLWNFHGNLLVFSLESASYLLNVVNNFKIYYIYDSEQKINVLYLLDLISKGIGVVCLDKKSKKEFYRITQRFPIGTSNKIKNLINYIKE